MGFDSFLREKSRSELQLGCRFGVGDVVAWGIRGEGGVVGHYLGVFCFHACLNLKIDIGAWKLIIR